MSYRSFTAATVILLITLLPGCGRKSSLIPPQRLVPERINDLSYVLDENSVTLGWSYPAKMENGDSLQAIEYFEIYRAVIPEKEYCPGCPVRYEDPVEIEGGSLPPPGARSGAYKETNLQNGYRYLYKVRSRAGGWYASSDSNVVTFVRGVPPKAPRSLQTRAGDRSLALSWEPVQETIEGKVLEQPAWYRVYRRSGNDDFSVAGGPVQEPVFTDEGLINARPYSYKVRALAAYGGDTLQPGSASQEISGVPRDLIPPPQPQHLVAVAIPEGVKLFWQAVAGDDLAGYRIYRRQEESGTAELIAEVGPDRNDYIDRAKGEGRKLFYSVTSFDTAQPANESLPAPEQFIDAR